MKRVQIQTHKGFALLLALIVSSVVLAIGVSILNISVNQINLSATARESEFAFQAAHAGVDCMWYWRNEDIDIYKAADVVASPQPNIQCFGGAPFYPAEEDKVTMSGGHMRYFTHTFQWGDPERCTVSDLYVMNALTDDITYDFSDVNTGVGTNGVKECEVGNVCTVIIARGYNRACDEIDSSIFSIQREIVVEF